MLVSVVLRLVPDQLALGQLVGEVEDVASGKHHAVRGTADLVDICQRVAHGDTSEQTVPSKRRKATTQ